MASRAFPAIEPEELLSDLLRLDPALRREAYYRERSIFYNPGGVAPLGAILASIKDRDGPNEKAAKLSLLVESLAVLKVKWTQRTAR